MTELERIDAEIERCRDGGRAESDSGPAWLCLLGYCDWTMEREFIREEERGL